MAIKAKSLDQSGVSQLRAVNMVSMLFCVLVLAVFFPEVVPDGSVARRYDLHTLQDALDNIDGRLAIVTGEAGVEFFAPHSQPNVVYPDGGQRRTQKVHVNFNRTFSTIPWVSVGLSRIDAYNNANLRIDVSAEAVSTSGFDAVVYEWGDTTVVHNKISWIACNV